MLLKTFTVIVSLGTCVFLICNMSALQWSKTAPIPKTTRQKIVTLWFDGENPHEIATRFVVSWRSVDRIIKQYLSYGNVDNVVEQRQRLGINRYNKKINEYDDFIVNTSLLAPATTLKQYRNSLYDQYGIYFSQSTLHRFFVDKNISWKKGSRHALESDPLEIDGFLGILSRICTDRNQLLFGDESHRNDCTANKRYGRSAKSHRTVLKTAFRRGEYKLSLLLFVGIFGPECYKIFHGSVNEERFNQFCADRLVDVIGNYPQRNSIILIDNVKFHHNDAIRNMIEGAGAILCYLPRYTPWINLCEYVFHGIKERERSRGFYGEAAALLSLIESVEAMKGCNWSKILDKLHIGV